MTDDDPRDPVGPAVVRRRPTVATLAGRLVAGCGVLILTTAIPTTEYMDLSRSAARSDADEDASLPRAMPVTVVGFEKQGGVPREADPTSLAASRQRIAANIILRSGYLTSATLQTDPVTGAGNYSFALRPEVVGCATPPPAVTAGVPAAAASVPGAMDSGQAVSLAIAAVAVEKFNRNPLQRKLEWWFVEASQALSGRLPDLSLGPAQIRPSTVRWLAGQPGMPAEIARLAGNDQALAETLSDECASLGLAAALIAAQACKGCDDAAAHAVRAYAGQRRHVGAAIDHAEIVRTMAALIR